MSPIPRALIESPLVPLPTFDGYLVLCRPEAEAITCPSCDDSRALGLAVLRQDMSSGEWGFSCLVCAGPLAEVA
jgi:hypothetical protein